jgi:hypothetical protein
MTHNGVKIDTEKLTSNLMLMEYKESDCAKEIKRLLNWFDSLPETIKLYRVLVVKSQKDINYSAIGSHFGMNKQELIDSRSFCDSNMFLVTVMVNKSDIDVNMTLATRIVYPNENEITVKDKGKNVKIVSTEKIEYVFDSLLDDEDYL